MKFEKHWAATLDDYVIDLAWSPDGNMLAVASAAGAIFLYDGATGALRHRLAGHENGTNALAWSPAGALVASGGQDGFVRLWDTDSGQTVAETKIGSAWVDQLAWITPTDPTVGLGAASSSRLFAAAGKKLVALNSDGSIAHTFPDAPKTITALAGNAASVPTVAGSASAATLASAYFGGVVGWDATTYSAVKEFPYGNAIHALLWSPDHRWLVAGCQDNAVHLWIPAEDIELHMSGYETKLRELSFSHDSKWLATGGGHDACVWDCTGAGPEGREPLLLPHASRVVAVAFQNQHGLLATAAANGEFSLWSPTRKNPLIAEVKMPSPATKFAWRADDSLLAVGSESGVAYVFKVES